jgi:hypothetical protein
MLNSATGILLLHHHEFILQINQICLLLSNAIINFTELSKYMTKIGNIL